jgi:hypothetical protein
LLLGILCNDKSERLEGLLMENQGRATHYFLGANSPNGFVSRFEELYCADKCKATLIMKGGPGTGKSWLIEKTGKAMLEHGKDVEYIHCSTDPDSLDGIIVPSIYSSIGDGTLPHSIEPKWPGVVDYLIDLGEYWDKSGLISQKGRIIELQTRINALYERAFRFLNAAGSLNQDTYRCALECVDSDKLDKLALKIARRELNPIKGKQGLERCRFLSAITANGIKTYFETVNTICQKVYSIDDEYGTGRLLLSHLRSLALDSGYDIITCFCPMSPFDKIEHILIPELNLGFITSNHWHKYDGEPIKNIHISRFTDINRLKTRRPRISFNRRAYRDLIEEAVIQIANAKQLHDILKDCYTPCMDFEKVDKKCDEIIEGFLK